MGTQRHKVICGILAPKLLVTLLHHTSNTANLWKSARRPVCMVFFSYAQSTVDLAVSYHLFLETTKIFDVQFDRSSHIINFVLGNNIQRLEHSRQLFPLPPWSTRWNPGILADQGGSRCWASSRSPNVPITENHVLSKCSVGLYMQSKNVGI